MKKLEDYEYISRFFEFDLSEEELAEFERRLRDDPEFARRVDLFREMEDLVHENLPQETVAAGNTAVDQYEMINRFFYYEMDQEELTAFEESVEKHPPLADRMGTYLEMDAMLGETVPSERRVLEKKKAFQQELNSAPSPGGKVKKMSPMRMLIGIAATLLLLIVAWLVIPELNGTSNEELAMQYWETSTKLTFGELRSETDPDDTETALLEASRLFSDEQYQGVLDRLDGVVAGDSLFVQAVMLRGETQMAIGAYDAAAEQFQQVIDAPAGTFRDVALWFQALAYLQLGEVEAARNNLSAIINGGYPLAGKARELTGQLND